MYVSYEEILKIARAPTESVMERRTQTSALTMYSTDIRVGALFTLPIKAIDLENRFVYQYPSLGVHTKNNKSAKTVIYPIPVLLDILKAWNNEVRKVLPEDGFWFAPLIHETGEINPFCKDPKDNRANLLRKNLKTWLSKVSIPYRSPHKFRHGHVHYGQAHSKTQEDYKAVSQNVMHSTTGITDQFYSNMNDEEKKNRIDSMFESDDLGKNKIDEYREFQEYLTWKKISR